MRASWTAGRDRSYDDTVSEEGSSTRRNRLPSLPVHNVLPDIEENSVDLGVPTNGLSEVDTKAEAQVAGQRDGHVHFESAGMIKNILTSTSLSNLPKVASCLSHEVHCAPDADGDAAKREMSSEKY